MRARRAYVISPQSGLKEPEHKDIPALLTFAADNSYCSMFVCHTQGC